MRQTAAILAIVLGGLCGCNASRDRLAVYDRHFEHGQLKIAVEVAQNAVRKDGKPSKDNILWILQLGAAERMEGRFEQSTQWFDQAEELMQYYTQEGAVVIGQAAATAINDNITPYKGTTYDGVMTNTYKALNFMQVGEMDLARVELNRALDRQRRAKEDFTAQIQSRQEQLNSHNNIENARRSTENADFKAKLEQAYPSLYNFEAYPDFVNPFATYLAGVYFAAIGEYGRAADLVRETAGMTPDNLSVWGSLDALEAVFNTFGSGLNPTVWVFYENGLGPVKEEFRIDLPVFIATDRVLYYGLALPRLVFRGGAGELTIWADGQIVRAEQLADIDRVVQTEFQREYGGILLRAAAGSIAKAVAQYAMSGNNNNDFLPIVMALYSAATTAADVRMWTSLPKTVETARLAMPAEGRLTLTAGQAAPVTVELDACRHAIVMVRQTTPAAVPVVDVIRF